LGASPSWPRRRILIPVTAGSSPAALTNSSRGLGREGAGSHKAGVAGSTPVPATISGGSGTGWTRYVRRSPIAQLAHHPSRGVRNGLPLPVPIAADHEIGGHSISPDFVQWQDARLWTGRRGVRFSQSGPDTGLVQWQNAGLQNPMSTVRFSQPVPTSSSRSRLRSVPRSCCGMKCAVRARHSDHPAFVEGGRSWSAGSSSLPTSKDDTGVDASEAESVRNRMLYRHAPGLTGDEVDAFRGRVAIFEIESGRRDLVA